MLLLMKQVHYATTQTLAVISILAIGAVWVMISSSSSQRYSNMALTVGELIRNLKQYGEDMEVHFSYNYGDYWRTQVAAEVTHIDSGTVKYSAYHQMDKVVDLNDEERDEEGNLDSALREVVILSA